MRLLRIGIGFLTLFVMGAWVQSVGAETSTAKAGASMGKLIKDSAFYIESALRKPIKASMSKSKPTVHKSVPGYRRTDTRSLRYFSNVNIKGKIDTVLKPVKRGASIRITADSRDLSLIKTKVVNDTLYVWIEKRYHQKRGTFKKRPYPLHGPVDISISVVQLNGLSFKGRGDIVGRGIYSSNMDIDVDAVGKLTLTGKIGLRKLHVKNENIVNIKGVTSEYLDIEMDNGEDVKRGPDIRMEGFVDLKEVRFAGNGNLSLFWIDSPTLLVNGYGTASIHLAGYVNLLNMNLYNYAEMDGQYLRVRKAYIKTAGHSLARLQPIKQLNVLATGWSNVYYYNVPDFKAQFMTGNGSVLNFQPFWF